MWHLKIGPKSKKQWSENAENNTNELRPTYFHQKLALNRDFWKSGPNLSSDLLIFNQGQLYPKLVQITQKAIILLIKYWKEIGLDFD